MARVIAIGQPVNDDERKAIAYLRDHLPDSYTLVHNFEIVQRNGEFFEVDIALLAPHAVYLIDVKGTRGLIDVYGSRWYPEGRQPYASPVSKFRGHSRTLKGIITDSQPARPELDNIYTDAAVILTAPNAQLIDRDNRDSPYVTPLRQADRFFQNASRIPARFSRNISSLHSLILRALQANSRPRSGAMQFGNWIVCERLSGPNEYTDYRVTNAFAGPNSGMVLLRAYKADPYLPEAERTKQKTRIKNAYIALNRMPPHPNILGVRDFFPNEAEDRFFLITQDTPGRALKLHLEKTSLTLTFDQKISVATDILSALQHAHQHGVTHRNLNPSTVLVGTDGRVYLVGFDYARTGSDRSYTIADEITEELDRDYQAPECQGKPDLASAASDMFAAGLLFYELFVGTKPFTNPGQINQCKAIFPVKPSELRAELPFGFDTWLQSLCTLEIRNRPTATLALTQLKSLLANSPKSVEPEPLLANAPTSDETPTNYEKLNPGTQIGRKYVVQKRLGKGGYGVVYKVIDTLGDMPRALKLILRDRHSVLERLKKEYRTLLRIPSHEYVVQVIEADPGDENRPPYIVFEYVDGIDVGEMIDYKLFAPEDGLKLATQVTEGLVHLHKHGIYHCDIKPRNLLWTDNGVRILDFNVSVVAAKDDGQAGGTRRYIPPDLDVEKIPQPTDLVDRDLYALGITIYEALTGNYPWETTSPPPGQAAKDPRGYSGLTDLEPAFIDFILKAIAPQRSDRFSTAAEMQEALTTIRSARRLRPTPETIVTLSALNNEAEQPQSGNSFLRYLLTLYSQSKRSNAGTRGLDSAGLKTYVSTRLDDELIPAVLNGEFKLVIITGNAGDGKTAFLQQLEHRAADEGATLNHFTNGCRISLRGRDYLSNYDGSQDEGNRENDEVLEEFFAPFQGDTDSLWQVNETRLIAINEGRLVDFLESRSDRFRYLQQLVTQGLKTGQCDTEVAIVNLNLRTVVFSPGSESILERQIRRFTHEKFWEPCKRCEIADRCYALHNAQTFQDPIAGAKVIERLKTLYTLAHLRNRLHITLRDLRSALSFLLISNRNCDEIKQLYATGAREAILDSYYFNSWCGGEANTSDRLLKLLRTVDIGNATDARLDRELDFVSPSSGGKCFTFEQRSSYDPDQQSSYDQRLLKSLYDELPRAFAGQLSFERIAVHQRYLTAVRRRFFFEQRSSEQWRTMLPYRSASTLLEIIQGMRSLTDTLSEILLAINRGEGLSNPACLNGDLALQVREVEAGSVRSYRIFPKQQFELRIQGNPVRFVEQMPSQLLLQYHDNFSHAELQIDLDMFEMLDRLNRGYKPSIEQIQGYYLSLIVFKNLLASAPYQEVLLTSTGYDFYRIQRHSDGRLQIAQLGREG